MTDDDEHLRRQAMGQIIRDRRAALDLTQRALASRAGFSGQGAIQNYESGGRVPKWPELRALARALRMDPRDIIAPLLGPARGDLREDSEDSDASI